MRINVYNEELTDEVQVVTTKVTATGRTYIGLRFMLKSTDALHHVGHDDDRSAVTFWVGTGERGMRLLQNALDQLGAGWWA